MRSASLDKALNVPVRLFGGICEKLPSLIPRAGRIGGSLGVKGSGGWNAWVMGIFGGWVGLLI